MGIEKLIKNQELPKKAVEKTIQKIKRELKELDPSQRSIYIHFLDEYVREYKLKESRKRYRNYEERNRK